MHLIQHCVYSDLAQDQVHFKYIKQSTNEVQNMSSFNMTFKHTKIRMHLVQCECTEVHVPIY